MSWYRETFYADPKILKKSELIREAITNMVAGAKKQQKHDILSTTVLCCGLLLRDTEATLKARASIAVMPAPPSDSSLDEGVLKILEECMSDLLTWAGHGRHVEQPEDQKRGSKPTRKTTAGPE